MARLAGERRHARLGLARVLVTALPLVGAWVACAAPSPQAASVAQAPPSRAAGYVEALGQARSARDRAVGMSAPSPADFIGSTDPAVEATLQKWATNRRDATQAAQRAYDDALLLTYEKSDEAAIHAELADLWRSLLVDARTALLSAAPAAYRDDAVFLNAVGGATAYALRDLAARIAAHLEACVRLAGDAACRPALERFARATDPTLSSGGGEEPSAVAARGRAVLRTTHPRPCTFRGTLFTRGVVYADETGTGALLSIEVGEPIEVETLEAPLRAGGRYKVTVTWPQDVEGYLEAVDPPFTLSRGTDLPADTGWATEGARYDASDPRGPTVRLTRRANPASRARDDGPDRRFFCHDLELATSPPSPARPTVGAIP